MDVTGINNKIFDSTIENAKSQAAGDDFEKRLKNAMEQKDDKELKKVCKEFEGMLLTLMYKQMKATVPKSDLLPTDAGRDVFESMLDEKLVEEASEGRGIGLGDVLYKQLSKKLNVTYEKPYEK